jgi:hypothetical protein
MAEIVGPLGIAIQKIATRRRIGNERPSRALHNNRRITKNRNYALLDASPSIYSAAHHAS